MLDTSYLKPQNKPKAYFRRDQDGSLLEITGDSKRLHAQTYAADLERYVRLVNRVRRCFRRTAEEVDEREIQVVQDRLTSQLGRIATATGPMPDSGKWSMPDDLQAFYEAQRVIELGKRLQALEEEVQRTTQTFWLQELSTASEMTRRALDQAVADVQPRRWAYRHLQRDYESQRAIWERMLAEKYTRHERAIQTLVGEIMEGMLETH